MLVPVHPPASRAGSRSRSTGRAGRPRRLLVLVGALVLLAGACNRSNTPSSYDETTQKQFMAGCTGNTSDDAESGDTSNAGDGTPTTLASQDACACAYEWLVINVPYNDANKDAPITIEGIGSQNFTFTDGTFQGINDDLADNPEGIPQPIQDGLAEACADHGWHQPPSTSGGGPTTVPR
jgi:hypothetical protein